MDQSKENYNNFKDWQPSLGHVESMGTLIGPHGKTLWNTYLDEAGNLYLVDPETSKKPLDNIRKDESFLYTNSNNDTSAKDSDNEKSIVADNLNENKTVQTEPRRAEATTPENSEQRKDTLEREHRTNRAQ